jgi:Icc-related predicted phosphoesterase
VQVRLLALADQPPRGDLLDWVRGNRPDAVVCCGDLDLAWIEELREIRLPKLGVYGNHDDGYMPALGISDLHLRRLEAGGVSFCGFEGCVRYRDGPHQYTQEEASSLARALPPADVLVCHAPPAGINDEPGDRAHEGFAGLREWIRANAPRLVLHGHTHPRPGGGVRRVGDTRVVHVAGARIVEL